MAFIIELQAQIDEGYYSMQELNYEEDDLQWESEDEEIIFFTFYDWVIVEYQEFWLPDRVELITRDENIIIHEY